MGKLIAMVGLVGSLLAVAVPATAQNDLSLVAIQGGVGDPLTLAASGAVVPFFLSGSLGAIALVQVASPVGPNPDAHMFFYNATCTRIPVSAGLPLTENDIAFLTVGDVLSGFAPPSTDGLIALAKADASGFRLVPLDNPVHVRVYEFRPSDGLSEIIEPIILDTAEFATNVAHWWSPLRSGATFFAPLQTDSVVTDLWLFCPLSTIVGASSPEPAAFGVDPGGTGDAQFTSTGFPQINPRLPAFPGSANNIRVRIYNADEVFKRDFQITCTCNSPFVSIAQSISPFYGLALPGEALDGTYTELTSVPAGTGLNVGPRTSFTGYTATHTVGSAINTFYGRLQNGSQLSIDGPAVVTER
ncbi:MAG TPA: hypothetical protein VMS64_31515 [Candidatus Methylomirabilis sp.]|nr:hypothetical protein [Candidatus Methylomirabilis sp.]